MEELGNNLLNRGIDYYKVNIYYEDHMDVK